MTTPAGSNRPRSARAPSEPAQEDGRSAEPPSPEPGRGPPTATYRLQLREGITFREAASRAPYLSALGVSHVYASPFVEARSGSSHGYDVVDPTRVDPALGGEDGLEHLVATLRTHGMALLADWVPNHVGIAQGENAWWQHVLEYGQTSGYAEFFDIDWEPARPELQGKVLIPVLGRPYGDILESGELEPQWNSEQGLYIHYHEHGFPVSPWSCARFLIESLLGPDSELAEPARNRLRERVLPLRARARSARGALRASAEKRALIEQIAGDPVLSSAVEQAVSKLAGEKGRQQSFEALHQLLEQQHYRLAYWRVAGEEINYRRFFDINELAALRMERTQVFEQTHRGVLAWIEAGHIDGLRIDHVDGLADPRHYCAQLRQRSAQRDLYLVVEKILATDELPPTDWPIDGTTGYEFLNQLTGLFVDPGARGPLDRFHTRFTQDSRDFDAILYASKKRVMQALLPGDLEGLASHLDRIAQSGRWTRDYTRGALLDALEEIVAFFPVYRTYVSERRISEHDRRYIGQAVKRARRESVDPESGLFEWIERVLTGDALSEARAETRQRILRFISRFQQYTAPVMAKGFEDTSLYRYHRLTALNEVGGDPRRFGVSPKAFHVANAERAIRWPRTLLGTSSHDTKRGEDTRARIAVLSERALPFARHVRQWARSNRPLKRSLAGETAPVAKDEYLIYQTLLGTWPAGFDELDTNALSRYRERIQLYMEKALREGKERSSWRHPDSAYERATTDFIERMLSPGADFLESFRPFQSEVAERGAQNSLSAVALKLCAPGIPDVYQGCELWDLSLADPDNRRPVDFDARHRTLEALERQLGGLGTPVEREPLIELLRAWPDGRIKLFLTWRLLAQRRARPELFVGAHYLPLSTRGRHARRLVTFARQQGGTTLLVLAPRLVADLPRDETPFPLGARSWADTSVVLPRSLRGLTWRSVLTGHRVAPPHDATAVESALRAADLLDTLPVAALIAEA